MNASSSCASRSERVHRLVLDHGSVDGEASTARRRAPPRSPASAPLRERARPDQQLGLVGGHAELGDDEPGRLVDDPSCMGRNGVDVVDRRVLQRPPEDLPPRHRCELGDVRDVVVREVARPDVVQVDRADAERSDAHREGEQRRDRLAPQRRRERRPVSARGTHQVRFEHRAPVAERVPARPLTEVELQLVDVRDGRVGGGQGLRGEQAAHRRDRRPGDADDRQHGLSVRLGVHGVDSAPSGVSWSA